MDDISRFKRKIFHAKFDQNISLQRSIEVIEGEKFECGVDAGLDGRENTTSGPQVELDDGWNHTSQAEMKITLEMTCRALLLRGLI
jgi:hypothetical protein